MVKFPVQLICLMVGLDAIGALQPEPQLSLKEHSLNPEEYLKLRKVQDLGLEFIRHYENITESELELPSMRLPSAEDLQCLADINLMMKGVGTGSVWALKMIDSWGSKPAGMLNLNLIDMGNFDECLKINKLITDAHMIQGKYCLAEIPFLSLLGFDFDMIRSVNIKVGVCFPASCQASHINTLLNRVFQQILPTNSSTMQLVTPQSCRTSDPKPFDALTIFTIVLLSIFGGLAILATLYDYFFCEDQARMPGLIRIFSIRATSRALFRITEAGVNPNVIDCLNGLRCMSLIWVVFGHEYMVGMTGPNINQGYIANWLQQPFQNLILHGVFSVDTFFFLSGLLVILIAMRSMEKSKGKLNVAMMYLHRFLRLTPMLAVAIVTYMTLIPYLAVGPLDDVGFDDYSKCERTWYLTLLYVQNYATTDLCLAHSWYLGVDMQMYIISPLLLFGLYKWGKRAAIAIVVLMLALSAWMFTLMITKGYSNVMQNSNEDQSQEKLYYYTHFHATPWIVGAVFGYFLHKNRGKSFKLSRWMVWLGWLLALAMMFTAIFAIERYNNFFGPKLSRVENAFYYTFTRIGWPLALSWVVFACMQGYGGMANSFLSSPLWQPVSKLSFSAYVWHLMIQEITIRRVRTYTYFSNYDMMLRFWSDFGFTMLVAYAAYVTIESPLGGLESLLLNRRPRPQTKVAEEPITEIVSEKPSTSRLEGEQNTPNADRAATNPK